VSGAPVAWLDDQGRLVRLEGVGDGGYVAARRAIPDSWQPLHQAAALSRRVAELEQVLRVCRATLPHMGGNPMSTHSLCADIDAALKGQG
jgi:hypothetical protein